MEANMTVEGLKYMVLGMTTVFLFLLLLIFILKMQAKLFNKYFPQKPVSVSPASAKHTTTSSAADDEEAIAVITAAITEFKKG